MMEMGHLPQADASRPWVVAAVVVPCITLTLLFLYFTSSAAGGDIGGGIERLGVLIALAADHAVFSLAMLFGGPTLRSFGSATLIAVGIALMTWWKVFEGQLSDDSLFAFGVALGTDFLLTWTLGKSAGAAEQASTATADHFES